MNDLKIVLGVMDGIVTEIRRDGLSFAEKCGLYAAARTLGDDVRTVIREEFGGDSYALEKIRKAIWHIGAILGFDVTNGHGASQHFSWAVAEMSSLHAQLEEAIDRRETGDISEEGAVTMAQYRGRLTLDGSLVDQDAVFPVKPAVGDLEWSGDDGRRVVRIERVELYSEFSEVRYDVYASTA